MPVKGNLFTLMHRSFLRLIILNPCGKPVHNLSSKAEKPRICRCFSVHRRSYPQVVGLWIFSADGDERISVFPPNPSTASKNMHNIQWMQAGIRRGKVEYIGEWAFSPQGCGRTGRFIHSFSKAQNAGRSRAAPAFPQFPQALLLLL